VVTAAQRRQLTRHLQEAFGVSERRACRVLGQPRSTQRQRPSLREEEERLVRRILRVGAAASALRLPADLGAAAPGRAEGQPQARLAAVAAAIAEKVPRKQRKKRQLGSNANNCARRLAEYKGHVWEWDFLHDRTAKGGPLKWFTLVDEYTRECLALKVGRGMTARAVTAVLAGGARARGAGAHWQRQRAEVHHPGDPGLDGRGVPGDVVHRAGGAESFKSKVRGTRLANHVTF
jgi:transposase InsO family protein